MLSESQSLVAKYFYWLVVDPSTNYGIVTVLVTCVNRQWLCYRISSWTGLSRPILRSLTICVTWHNDTRTEQVVVAYMIAC